MSEFLNEKKKLAELEKNKEFEKIQKGLDEGCNFIDYFLVIGLEPEIYKKEWLYKEEFETMNEKHKKEIKPKIISSFPPFEKSTISFDDSILSHVFPHGYQLIRNFTPPKPKVFSFILDNNYFNINYPQKYLSCLICYERVTQYKKLYEMQKIKDSNDINKIDQKNIDNITDPDIYIPKCLLLMSLYPFFGEMEKIITEIYNYSLNQIIELKPESNDNATKKMKKKQTKRLSSVKEVSFKEKDVNEPIEKIIENLLIELPVPPQGISTVKYLLNEKERTIKQNEMNKLPLIDINLKRICLDFEAKDIITIYNYLFLESRILFFSKNIEYLNSYIYGLLALLYPFQYQYQIITILPEENFEILESITPFIAGINQAFQNDFFEKNNFVLSDCFFVVDIDQKKFFSFNEEIKIPEFPKNYRKTLEKKLQDLINKSLKEEKKMKFNYIKQKTMRNSSIMIGRAMTTAQGFSFSPNESTIDTKLNTMLTMKDSISSANIYEDTGIEDENDEDEEITEMLSDLNIDFNFNQEVNELFFDFNANLLSNYNQFLNRDFYSSNTAPSLEVLFKVAEFLKKIPPSDKNFYDKFITETQIFGDFLYLRMIPKNTKEKIRILLFDEKINENSKNVSTIFTNTKEYQFIDNVKIQGPRTLTQKEINFYKDIKNQKNLINYGIVVSKDSKDENKVSFNYLVFPKLTNLLFLSDNISVYYLPENWSENINQINEDLISKSHLGDVSIRLDDMKKYIYLCWMHMWSLTFWYSEEKEKNYWFQELVRIIEESSCYEMEIFNLLFEAINKYGKELMVLKLYDLLLKRKLNPSFKVHNMVMKIMENKKDKGKIKMKENFNKQIKKEEKRKFIKSNFGKRTFRTKYYTNILTENIYFYAFDTCIFCQNDINLEKISKNYKEMNRDVTWTKCSKCNELILPKLTVQFGEEINKMGDMKTNTCNYDTVVLFSPYILKNNYTTSFSRNVGVKLDVDELMMKYSSIYWNSLWYFKIEGLEYDFMLPYYYKLQEIKPYKELKVSLVEKGKNESDDEDENEPFDLKKFKISKNSFTVNKINIKK